MRIIEVTDLEGRKHKVDADALDAKQFAKDGEKHSFNMMAMDTAGDLFIADGNQLKGATDMTDNTKLSDAEISYQIMCKQLDYRSRTSGDARESADDAYHAARKQLEDAWRNNR